MPETRKTRVPSGWRGLPYFYHGLLRQIFIILGYREERAARASFVGYLQILFAGGWGWMLFDDVPDVWTWVGSGVIVLSTLILVRGHPAR